MEIRRITAQGHETLEEFYQRLIDGFDQIPGQKSFQCMLDLLGKLREDGPEPLVWGLTSHSRMCLHAVDDWTSTRLVLVEPTLGGTWHIHCALPPELSPWPDAKVSGYTEDLNEAVRRVRMGLEWAGILTPHHTTKPDVITS